MNRRSNASRGFTIIELMLSMTFISVMLVAIAMLVIQVSTLYTRGETLRQINQVSRSVTDDMRRTFAAADQRRINTDKITNGRLCLGSFSYIWNVAAADSDHDAADANKYAAAGSSPIRLIRIADQGGQYCRNATGGVAPHVNSPIETAARPVELLQEGGNRLKVYDLKVEPVMRSGPTADPQLYEIKIRLGTSDSNSAIDTASGNCKPPTEESGDITYCAVNQITFTVRVGMR